MIEFMEAELRPSEHLCVAFTGARLRLGDIGFEFHKTLTDAPCAALFVRDLKPQWYQDVEIIQAGIARALRQTAAKRLTCLGNSMGGYGALLHGALAGADAILALAPQTVIGPMSPQVLGDNRWAEEQDAIPEIRFPDLSQVPAPATRVTLCCSADEPLDLRHIERLAGAWPTQTVIVEAGGHTTSRYLKEKGELQSLLQRALL